MKETQLIFKTKLINLNKKYSFQINMMIKNFQFIRMKNRKIDKKKVMKVIKINNTHLNKVIFNLRNHNSRVNNTLNKMINNK